MAPKRRAGDDARRRSREHRCSNQPASERKHQVSKVKSISTALAGKAAIAGGAFLTADGILQLVHSQAGTGSKVVGLAGHLNLAFFIAGLLLIAPSFIALARYARPGRAETAALAAAAGTTVLGLTSISSLVMGHDGVWFNVLAPLTNLAWLAGSIVLAVSLRRAGRVSLVIAVGLPIAWVATIVLATHGGGLISGAYYLTVGYLLANGAVERPRPARVAEAG
jgi:hypothetical protein